MDFLQALVIGVVQGITEWLPISSEGINSLVLTQFYNTTLSEAIIISIWLHIGTLFAALIYLRKDVVRVLNERDQTFWFLVVATVVSVLIAAPFMLLNMEFFLMTGKSIMILIGLLLIFTGIVQFYAKKQKTENKKPTMKDAVIAGIAQGLAILPGLSRSGLTVSVLLFRKYHPKQSIKLSFLMSIPALIIAGAWTSTNAAIEFTISSFTSLLSSFILGLITIAVLLKAAERINFSYFCFLIGVISIIAGLI